MSLKSKELAEEVLQAIRAALRAGLSPEAALGQFNPDGGHTVGR